VYSSDRGGEDSLSAIHTQTAAVQSIGSRR